MNVCVYTVNIHQEQQSIRNMQVVSSICVHCTHSCEANKVGILSRFLPVADHGLLIVLIKTSTKLRAVVAEAYLETRSYYLFPVWAGINCNSISCLGWN